jgi:hypothetical protein
MNKISLYVQYIRRCMMNKEAKNLKVENMKEVFQQRVIFNHLSSLQLFRLWTKHTSYQDSIVLAVLNLCPSNPNLVVVTISPLNNTQIPITTTIKTSKEVTMEASSPIFTTFCLKQWAEEAWWITHHYQDIKIKCSKDSKRMLQGQVYKGIENLQWFNWIIRANMKS